MNFKQAWDYLDQLQFFKIKLGLDSMTRFLRDLDNPQDQHRYVHIGGTNGKGSVGALLLSVLTEAGYRVGFYSSPHLSSVRERFRIGKTFIPEKAFAMHASRIRNVLDGRQITYFEFTTTLAFLWFAAEEVDLVLLEVGMGGRLDATNVVTPLVSVITNVAMDHEQYLGNTLAEVATEKAGIIKPAVPVVSGVADDDSLEIVAKTCRIKNSPLFLLGRDFYANKTGSTNEWEYVGIKEGDDQALHMNHLPSGLSGDHQIDNSGVALATIELLAGQGISCDEAQVRKGVSQAWWPGRMEEFWRDNQGKVWWSKPQEEEDLARARHYLLDGAHNPAGVLAFTQSLEKDFSYERIILIWAAMADKDIKQGLSMIAPLVRTIVFTRPESERSATPEELRASLDATDSLRVFCESSVEKALEVAVLEANSDDLICVAGSLYLVGKVRQILCGDIVD